MDWYERHPTDYKNDTWHLSLAEHGAYTLLLDHYYANEAPLPDVDRALSSICNCSVEEWLNVKHNVIAFFKVKNGKLRQKNCDKIISKSYKHRNDGAKRSAKYRKNKGSVTRYERVSNASTGEDRTGQDKEEYILLKFDAFWSEYPRKVGKKKAEDAYMKALKTFNELDDMDAATILVDSAIKYAEVTTDMKFCKHPATWLNGECWNDDIAHVQPAEKISASKMQDAFADLRSEAREIEQINNLEFLK